MSKAVRKLPSSELLPILRIGYLRRMPDGKTIRSAEEFADCVAIIMQDANIIPVKELKDDR